MQTSRREKSHFKEDVEVEEIQECFCCHKTKQLSEFYKHKLMANGHIGKCKECSKAAVRQNYAKNIKHYAEYDKLRSSMEERNRRRVERQRELRKLNPEKYLARLAVSNAIRHGELLKQHCECCGDEKAEAHHDDYNKPLDVIWLCFSCHLKQHNKQRRAA